MSFQDATDLSQLQPGPVAKAKQIQQKAPLSQGWLTYRTILHLGPSMLVILSLKKLHGEKGSLLEKVITFWCALYSLLFVLAYFSAQILKIENHEFGNPY